MSWIYSIFFMVSAEWEYVFAFGEPFVRLSIMVYGNSTKLFLIFSMSSHFCVTCNGHIMRQAQLIVWRIDLLFHGWTGEKQGGGGGGGGVGQNKPFHSELKNSEWIKSPQVGFEPTTNQLTTDRSTTKLLRNNGRLDLIEFNSHSQHMTNMSSKFPS